MIFTDRAMVLAHRGASAYAPENTMPAFRLAKRMHADGIEIDVHLTRDGALAVIHDDDTVRTAGVRGRVSDCTLAELQRLDVSMGMEGFAGARIPTLDEVFEFAACEDMFVNVELKHTSFSGAYDYLEKVLDAQRRYDVGGRVLYSSFNHYLLRELRQMDEAVKTGILYFCGLVDVWEYVQRVGACAVHPIYLCLEDSALVPQCHAHGIRVHPWTVDDEAMVRRVVLAGADAVITNKPDLALGVIGSLCGASQPAQASFIKP